MKDLVSLSVQGLAPYRESTRLKGVWSQTRGKDGLICRHEVCVVSRDITGSNFRLCNSSKHHFSSDSISCHLFFLTCI